MTKRPPAVRTAAAFIPVHPTLRTLREAAAGCTACDLWTRGTRTVFGEGPAGARVVLVGEQPGHEENLSGRPFVGPAGRVVDDALEAVGGGPRRGASSRTWRRSRA